MTGRTEILALAERVESGSGFDVALRNEVEHALGTHAGMKSILTSVDAVKALRERIFPRCEATIAFGEGRATASLWLDKQHVFTGQADTECRARLAAVLRAFAAKDGQA
ncbi:hypothetical protein LMIY3S_01088 [Labrys miyagiensis]